MNTVNIEKIELDLLLEAIQKCYGWDFSHYKKASLYRSIKRILSKKKLQTISDLIPIVIHDPVFLGELVESVSIPVTEMFRDPKAFLAIRQHVVPILKTYPFIKIWHAGCAGGEEVYSMAILLHEENIYERSRIYGTDINPNALQHAEAGVFSPQKIDDYESNYRQSGGKRSLRDYFSPTKYDAIIINSHLKKNISFFNHNLATDQSFGEMHMIVSRNVLIYFDKELQARVLELFDESLCYGGFLCLGLKEGIEFVSANTNFHLWRNKEKIYRKGAFETTELT